VRLNEKERELSMDDYSRLTFGVMIVIITAVTRARAQVRDHDQQVDDACVPGHLRVATAQSWCHRAIQVTGQDA